MPSPDFFQILGVERRYHLDEGALERRYHEQSRLFHPDRHAQADVRTRTQNALATSQLNQAYRALREPVKRAEHLLELEGIRIADERSGHKVSPAFLMEIMELREALAEAKAERDAARVRKLGDEVRARQGAAWAQVDAGFAEYENGARDGLGTIADALIADRYFRRFLDEVEAFEEGLALAGHDESQR